MNHQYKYQFLVIEKNDLSFARDRLLFKAFHYLNIQRITINSNTSFFIRQFNLIKKILQKNQKNQIDCIFLTSRCKKDILTIKIMSYIIKKPLITDIFYSTYDSLIKDRKIYKKKTIKAKMIKLFDIISVFFSDAALLDTNTHISHFKKNIYDRGNYHRVIMGADRFIHDQFYNNKIEKNNENFIVLYWGTFIPLHGIEYILQAAKKIKDPNIKFILIGDGQTRNKMQNLAKKFELKNTFFKEYSKEILLSEIALSDICLGLFSQGERAKLSIATKVFKAMAMKKTVITGKSQAMEELFEDKKDYVGINFGDANQLKEKIIWLKNNPTIKEKIANQSYKKYSNKGDIPSIAEDLNEIIQKLL